MSCYSKILEKLVNTDERLKTGSYYHNSDGHWATIELSSYSLDDSPVLGTVHAWSVSEFLGIVRTEIVNIQHEDYKEGI